ARPSSMNAARIWRPAARMSDVVLFVLSMHAKYRILVAFCKRHHVYGLLRHAVPTLTLESAVAKADKPDSVLC
ncbi:MAG: hypothetical protein RLZZ226_171, partial [Pseudomonadota bacterium]